MMNTTKITITTTLAILAIAAFGIIISSTTIATPALALIDEKGCTREHQEGCPEKANPAGSNMTGAAANMTGGAATANPAGHQLGKDNPHQTHIG